MNNQNKKMEYEDYKPNGVENEKNNVDEVKEGKK